MSASSLVIIQTVIDVLPGVTSEQSYRDKLAVRVKSGRIQKELPQTDPLFAEIDCGRWVTTCDCNSGIALHPAWRYAACLDCGRSWTDVRFPTAEMLALIDAVLRLRPPGPIRKSETRWYSWWKDETVADLIRQNRRHGWPVPEGA